MMNEIIPNAFVRWREQYEGIEPLVQSSVENDGIGSYEWHGSKGYDAGTDYIAGGAGFTLTFPFEEDDFAGTQAEDPIRMTHLIAGFLELDWERILDEIRDNADTPSETEWEDIDWSLKLEPYGYGKWTLDVSIGFTAAYDRGEHEPDPMDRWKERRENE